MLRLHTWSCRTIPALLAFALAAIAAGAQPAPSDREERVRAARAQLGELLTGGVEGRFVETLPRSYLFAPSRPDLPQAPVANPTAVSPMAVGPALIVRGTLREHGKLVVKNYTLRRLDHPVSAGEFTPQLKAATNVMFHGLEEAVKPGAAEVNSRSLRDPSAPAQEVGRSIRDIRGAYTAALRAGADRKTVEAIVAQWRQVRTVVADTFPDSDEFKALYGPQDNYPPWRYDVIYRQAPATVAIGEPNEQRSICSGVLLADDLVLTAAHCFSGPPTRPPNELEVWFGYAQGHDGVPPPSFLRRPIVGIAAPAADRLSELLDGAFSATLLDYAIVRFGATPGEPRIPETAAPQCVRTRPLQRGDSLYVIGYPRGDPEMVHDSARVYLPYRVREGADLDQLRMDVHADLLDAADRDDIMKQFDESYTERFVDPIGIAWRMFHHVKDGGQPRMGIVADTFKGNSGGPVYERDGTQCVVGILIAGAPDTGKRLTPSWKQHERVLPIGAVLDDLDRIAPEVRKRITNR